MTPQPSTPGPATFELSVPPSEAWTLHHVLLDRIDDHARAVGVDPETDGVVREADGLSPGSEAVGQPDPPRALYRAFARLDTGERRFTAKQVEAMQAVLAEYHHAATGWEGDRHHIEAVLGRLTTAGTTTDGGDHTGNREEADEREPPDDGDPPKD